MGFFRDIAGGGGRISLYRVQFFVTTVLLGSWFIYTVWQAKAMPNVPFSASVLFGLSSAMYLLSKWQLLGASFTRNSTDTGSKKLTADRAILRKLIAVVSVRDWVSRGGLFAAITVCLLAMVPLVIQAWQYPVSAWTTLLLWAGVCFMAASLVGFIFGVPHIRLFRRRPGGGGPEAGVSG